MSRSFSRHFLRSIASAVVAAACLFAGASAAFAQGLYKPPTNLATGTVPQGVASADLARSGFQSLVVTDSTNKTMKVYLGTGPGTFAPAHTYSTCTTPTAVVTGDFSGNGYPDIVVACPSTGNIEVFINDGTGAFDGGTSHSVANPAAMTVGNFTGTGQPDLAVASGTGGVTVFLNLAGAVTTRTATVTGTLSGITTADFNHDGHLDLAISDSANNTVHVLTGNGTGTFTPLGAYSTGANTKPSGIVTADFNNDGNADVATSNAGTNTATILLGSATGALTAQAAQAAGTKPNSIAVADVNSDGNPDAVVFDAVTNSTGATAVLLGNGNGTLQTAQFSSLAFLPGTLASVADFNRDGKPDLAVTQQTSNLVSVLLNNTMPTQYPDGRSYAAAHALTVGQGNMADSVAVGDFNKDGHLDIAVAYLEDNVVRVLLNSGTGSSNFNAATAYAVGKQPYWIASGDLNGDGYPDLVTANTTDGTISVLLNNRNGTFAAAATYTVGKQPFQVAIGDVNGDGVPDLAVSNYGGNTVTVLFGHPGGTFTVASTLTLGTGCSPYGAAIGDFSHNGFPDIAVSCNQTSQLYVFPNNRNGTFGTPFITPTGTAPGSLVVGDFNRDGKLDIVTGNTTANDISFFAGNGNGTFAGGVTGPSLNFPATIAAGDVNGDGILDIVGVAPNFNQVAVTLGVGDGTFGTFQQRGAGQFAAAKQPWGVALGDFNNDGQLDIVTANTYSQINIASPAYQARYMTQYPPIPAGNPSIDVLSNQSAVNITVTSSPASPLPDTNTGTTIKANVQPALSGGTPTGSVIFEDATSSPVGSGPYALSGGVATYNVGHLGSGQYLFTALYSGDASFQPATVSGAGSAIVVTGTPVTLTLNPSSVGYGGNFQANVTAIGNPAAGSYPHGTATIYAVSSGGTTFNLGTTNALQQNGFGSNNSSRTITITATAPDLNIGTYQVYAIFNPTSGVYPQGSSSYVTLTVTVNATSLVNTCLEFFIGGCQATVTPNAAPGSVNFSVNGDAPTSEAVIGGTATFGHTFGTDGLATYTVVATYVPSNGNYSGSTATATVNCTYFFGLAFCFGSGSGNSAVARSLPLNSFTGFMFNGASGMSARGPAKTQFSPFRMF